MFVSTLSLLALLGLISARTLATHKEDRRNDGWFGYRNVGYFTNWGIYDPQNFYVTNITTQDLTHINYAFANVDATNGTVFLDDPEVDIEYEYPGDNVDEKGNNLYGNLKQLYLLKKQNRRLKTLLSIGGATYSINFVNVIEPEWRETFINSSIEVLNNYGFDGLDVDFGKLGPVNKDPEAETEQGVAFTELLKGLREGLDQAAKKNGGGYYELTAAVGCGVFGWGGLDVSGMDKYLDFWNLMAYDFSGEWTPTALPASNLYHDPNPANDQYASGSECVQHYASEGVNSRKLVLGMPLYGTAFNGTQGLWTKWTDLGGGDYDQAGNYDDKHLPLEGAVMFYNKSLGASWSFDNSTGHVVSFDTPTVALQKAKYVMKNQLGGMMYWSIDQDYTKLQSNGKPNGRIWPGVWNKLKGTSKKYNYGKWKGAPWPLPDYIKNRQRRSEIVNNIESSELQLSKRGNNFGNWKNWAGWGEWEDPKQWKLKLDDNICTNIGFSLIDTVKTAFEKYGGGLDKTKNNLKYPNSVYDNIRSGLR
ncbi:uncharacterized protein I206_105384 [Kwoniella pini CBS 10737]|uniref:GH18 domain-containing protein n=1 Tax=Kwoniella pini CBS 10737 TaxID=1296096 RepID=A0A1B9I4E0_9TREE|nr:uncharacterized protein I206_03709 [Kwoniella pini CBS 10737]OCF50388.1 hypothetical protein I206_03709 [Kwoniella pini CBS 10737]